MESQANTKCGLLNMYLDGAAVVAEGEAEFDDVVRGVRERIREIAVLIFEGHLIGSLREHWASGRIGQAGESLGSTLNDTTSRQARGAGGHPGKPGFRR